MTHLRVSRGVIDGHSMSLHDLPFGGLYKIDVVGKNRGSRAVFSRREPRELAKFVNEMRLVKIAAGGYLLDSGSPYILW